MQRVAGVHQNVVRAVALAAFAEAILEVLHFLQIALAHFAGAGHDAWNAFQPLELYDPAEGKLQLVRIHCMEDDHLVATEAQVLDAVEDRLLVIEEVADEDDDSLAADLAGDLVEDTADSRLLPGLKASERGHDVMEAREVAGARDVLLQWCIEHPNRRRIALVENQISEAGGHKFALVELGDAGG